MSPSLFWKALKTLSKCVFPIQSIKYLQQQKIHFDNIFKFYQKCFANKRLYLYVTCTINNTWVERCLSTEAILLRSVFAAPTRLPVYHDNNGRRLISLYRITDPKLCLYGAQKCMSGFISINNIFFSSCNGLICTHTIQIQEG